MDAAYQPNLAAVRAAGAIAINGYLTGKFATTTTSPAAAHAAALGWIATYEEGPAELVGATRAQGVAVGEKIAAAWRTHGIPDDGSVAVFPSVDIRVAAADAASCDNGWMGIRDVLKSGASLRGYAEGAVIDHLAARGLVDGKCWLSASSSYPGYNVHDENVCMIQQVGSSVGGTDTNHIITDPYALGAWWPPGSPYVTPGGFMSLTSAQQDDLYQRVLELAPRYYTVDAEGAAHVVPKGTKGAVAAHALDDVSGNYIIRAIRAMEARLDALEKAEPAAAPPNVLTITGGQIDLGASS